MLRVRLWRVLIMALVAGCATASPSVPPQQEVRLGYFPNLTHSTAIVGVASGLFRSSLGSTVRLESKPFNAGPQAVEALFSNAIDASYIGPAPAVNAWARSGGKAVRIVAGATSGGAFLVTKREIGSPADLRGRSLATPGLGNTQDVALRTWLKSHGLTTSLAGGGDVVVKPLANADSLAAFISGQIDGAWVPEPWATRMIAEGHGRILVDERDLWPNGRYATTVLVVSGTFLDEHPDLVARLLAGHVAATSRVNTDPDGSQQMVRSEIEHMTGSAMSADVVSSAWTSLTFTNDPIPSSIEQMAADAAALGMQPPLDLAGIFALDPVNTALARAGEPTLPPQ